MGRLLYSSEDVRQAIVELFRTGTGRRVAISAFVGDGAQTLLPRPSGIELVCWPKGGGTNPNTLRDLIQKRVHIRFVDALHMKLYWAEGCGTIITSANLSSNALGCGGLREVGILLHEKAVDVDRILDALSPREVTDKEMHRLDREHDRLRAENPAPAKRKTLSFLEWFRSPNRREWKIAIYESEGPWSKAAIALVKNEFELTEPFAGLRCTIREFRRNDWVLQLKYSGNSVKQPEWLFVDRIVRVAPSDKKAYDEDIPCEAVQVWPFRRYGAPPFQIDACFRSSFKIALKRYGSAKLADRCPTKCPNSMLEFIAGSWPA